MPHRLGHPNIPHLQCCRHSCDWGKMKMKFKIYVKSKKILISHKCSLENNCDSHSLVSIGCFLNHIAECEMIMYWNTVWIYNLEAIHVSSQQFPLFFYNFSFTPFVYMHLSSIQYTELWNLDYIFIHVYISSNLAPNMLFKLLIVQPIFLEARNGVSQSELHNVIIDSKQINLFILIITI